jgi:hypothetical protein
MSKIFIFLALSWQKIRAKGTTLLGYDFTKGLAARQSPLFARFADTPHAQQLSIWKFVQAQGAFVLSECLFAVFRPPPSLLLGVGFWFSRRENGRLQASL